MKNNRGYPNPFDRKDNFGRHEKVESQLLWGNPDKIKNPWISVVMPVFNHPDYFKEALLSAVNQDFEGEYEIIVVDNTPLSDEKTANQLIIEEINSDKIIYYRNEDNIGMFGNWNRGVKLARGQFITLLHDDDLFMPATLSILNKYYQLCGESALLVPYLRTNESGETEKFQPFVSNQRLGGLIKNQIVYKYSMLNLILHMPTPGVGCLFSREKLIALGGYDEDQAPGADYTMLANYAKEYGLYILRQPNYIYRIAVNESFRCWREFPRLNLNLWRCMLPYMKWPNFILNRLIKANYNSQIWHCHVDWGKEDPATLEPVSKQDKRWLKIFNTIVDMNKFKISLPWK